MFLVPVVLTADRRVMVQCPPGRFSSTKGSTVCDDCPAGRATGNQSVAAPPGATECVPCTGGIRYQSQSAQALCSFCSTSFYYRTPQSGKSVGHSIGQCERCSDGAVCSESGIQSTDGYFVFMDESGELQSLICQPQFCTESSACDTGSTDGDSGRVFSCCAAGREHSSTNPLCGM